MVGCTDLQIEFVENALRCATRLRIAHYGYFLRCSRAALRYRDLRRADYAGQLSRIDGGEHAED